MKKHHTQWKSSHFFFIFELYTHLTLTSRRFRIQKWKSLDGTILMIWDHFHNSRWTMFIILTFTYIYSVQQTDIYFKLLVHTALSYSLTLVLSLPSSRGRHLNISDSKAWDVQMWQIPFHPGMRYYLWDTHETACDINYINVTDCIKYNLWKGESKHLTQSPPACYVHVMNMNLSSFTHNKDMQNVCKKYISHFILLYISHTPTGANTLTHIFFIARYLFSIFVFTMRCTDPAETVSLSRGMFTTSL